MADNLGPLPQVHPRELPCQKARAELADGLAQWRKRHNLTEAEYLSLVLAELSLHVGFLVNVERRPGA